MLVPRIRSKEPNEMSTFAKKFLVVWAAAIALMGGIMFALYTEDAGAENVRRSPIAGSWYPGTAEGLTASINKHINARAERKRTRKPLALIMPHAGYRWCGKVAAHGARLVRKGDYDRVIVIGPTHRGSFPGASVPTYTHYATPLGNVELDREVCDALLKKEEFSSQDRLHALEHSIEIELPWLQVRLGAFKLVPVMIGRADGRSAKKIAEAIKPFVDERTLLVASSDFVHYGRRFGYLSNEPDTKAFIERVDMGAARLIEKMDLRGFEEYFAWTGATICGRWPILVMMNVLAPDTKVERLSYARSGDETGDYSSSVSYLAMAFFKPSGEKEGGKKEKTSTEKEANSEPGADAGGKLNAEERACLLRMARETLTAALRDRVLLPLTKDAYKNMPHLLEKRGVFVTLRKKGNLRGCIGCIERRLPLALATRGNAVSAALRDRRFRPVTADELDDIHIEISVLTPLKRVKDPKEVVAGKHGIYLVKDGRSAVYLPQVATERGWNREQFLRSLCAHKARLPADAYLKPDAKLYTFEAQVFGESE